jgi:hypothetical protein
MILPNAALSDVLREAPVGVSIPRIVWPTMVLGESSYEEGDLDWFPEQHSYRERQKLGIGGAMSRAFRDAVRVARVRVWLLDEFLLGDEKSTDLLGRLFYDTGAWDLRIVTASKMGAEEHAKWLKDLEPDLQNSNRDTPPRIKILLNLNKATRDVPNIHDRFAVIDDVLWHCGATVGGLHDAINAMTFGWSAHTTHAIDFFDELCGILERDHD